MGLLIIYLSQNPDLEIHVFGPQGSNPFGEGDVVVNALRAAAVNWHQVRTNQDEQTCGVYGLEGEGTHMRKGRALRLLSAPSPFALLKCSVGIAGGSKPLYVWYLSRACMTLPFLVSCGTLHDST